MEPKIVTKPAFKAVGMRYYGKNEKGEIPKLWGEFMNKVSAQGIDEHSLKECYGLMGIMDNEGNFEYIACIPAEKFDGIPENMVKREISQSRYLVFNHVGSLEALHDTFDYIYNKYLPKCEYEVRPNTYHFEFYDERFNDFKEDSEIDIYIPIK
ncbi:GyrI-like domain-containing protein [Kosmotoga pacifica]|uniref:AraC effector-binding domain-containing protein n=1 Tax=Kosmotoga pacifica TaxID=1330330 RepID=A0A0G2ZCH7_9BACT|nr:GyrI-like domain-containing protein [Kosmotoga pacifica]AKI97806.1 hypothetical protein IX53_08285 [Kosmotoga pacifica]